jgi:hypothetical protein
LYSHDFTDYRSEDLGSIVAKGSWLLDLEQMIRPCYTKINIY